MSTITGRQYSTEAGAFVPAASVAILGAGRVGTTLARGLVAAGFDVAIAGSGATSDIALIARVLAPGARALGAASAVVDADVVILAVPLHRALSIDPALLAGKVVIDVMNYWEPVDGDLPSFSLAPTGTSRVIQSHFVGARVVKAFNHIGYHELDSTRRPVGAADRRAAGVAGDSPEAVAVVLDLVERLGFDAVYMGGLDDGIRLEAGGGAFGVWLNREQLSELVLR